VPGDEIVGFVTRGRGVSIHRTDCINVINLSKMEQARLIEAEWDSAAENETLGEYLGEFRIFCQDRNGLLVDISKVFTERGINITAINSKTSKQGIATLEVSFHTKGRSELNSLIEKIRQIDSVIDIERTSG
jgi:GTP pyrophosphokinase